MEKTVHVSYTIETGWPNYVKLVARYYGFLIISLGHIASISGGWG